MNGEVTNGSQESFGLTATVALTLAPSGFCNCGTDSPWRRTNMAWKAKFSSSSSRPSFERRDHHVDA